MNPIETIALVNQKGGVAKTTTVLNLGVGLAHEGKAVLLVDFDPQECLTAHCGLNPENYTENIYTVTEKASLDMSAVLSSSVIQVEEGVDLIPGNLDLSVLERDLWNCMNPYGALSTVLKPLRRQYDYILIDCGPSLGILTLNALAASDSALIPVQAEIQSLRGTNKLLATIFKTRQQIRPQLEVKGMVMTMASHTNHSRASIEDVRTTFAGKLHVFDTNIPRSIDAAEASKYGKSAYSYKPKNPLATAYKQFVQEVVSLEKQRTRQKSPIRI